MKNAKIAVIGCGVSGIATAYYLKKQGFKTDIFESESTIGGRAGSLDLDGQLIDIGGKNIGRNYPLFRRFIKDMGDYDFEFFGINSSKVLDGKIYTYDSQKKMRTIINLVKLSGVMSYAKFLRYASCIKTVPDNGYLDGPLGIKLSLRYDHMPITSYFNDKFTNNFLRPITIRMNGCEPEEYFLGNFGSNVKMVIDKYDQLKSGMNLVLRQYAQNFSIRTSTKVLKVLAKNGRVVGIRAVNSNGIRDYRYDSVFLCMPAKVSAMCIAKQFPNLSKLLKRIQYNPVALIVAKYSSPIFDDDVRSIVFGRNSILSNAGVYGIHNLDLVRYTFSGQKTREFINEQSNPTQLVNIAEKELSRYIPVPTGNRVSFVYKYFPIGLCSYVPYHYRFIDELQQMLDRTEGLFLTGDYIRGASLEACFRAAKENVEAFTQGERSIDKLL